MLNACLFISYLFTWPISYFGFAVLSGFLMSKNDFFPFHPLINAPKAFMCIDVQDNFT